MPGGQLIPLFLSVNAIYFIQQHGLLLSNPRIGHQGTARLQQHHE
jgi:hypothetical protein